MFKNVFGNKSPRNSGQNTSNPFASCLKSASILHGTNIHGEFSLAEDLFPVNVDENQMQQVIKNLIQNAREAMPEGGQITVSSDNVRIFKEDDLPLKPGHYTRIAMKDIGKGIPAENLPKIFDPFSPLYGNIPFYACASQSHCSTSDGVGRRPEDLTLPLISRAGRAMIPKRQISSRSFTSSTSATI